MFLNNNTKNNSYGISETETKTLPAKYDNISDLVYINDVYAYSQDNKGFFAVISSNRSNKNKDNDNVSINISFLDSEGKFLSTTQLTDKKRKVKDFSCIDFKKIGGFIFVILS